MSISDMVATTGARIAGTFKALRKDEDGVTAMEYGLIAALIAVVIIGAVTATGTAVSGVFTAVAAAMNGAL